ncbi:MULTISPECIES: chemotaxis protein CheA [unclassified Sphingomonas]|uniref:chemotaxis protein CheA n=1 Tax=unclassified Sphingomonas TaxID=196159 RepID=UPI00082E6532|nr:MULTISPECIES: chemotaxis protein CheW [unclassified Sphingomonas]
MDDLLQEFILETRETLEALSGEIVAWEADPSDTARLDAIFRFVHTVKGSCGFLDLPRLARLSHAAEDVLAQVRSGERKPDRALVNAVLAIVDRISELVEAIDQGVSLPDSGEELLIAALAAGSDEVAATTAAPAVRAASRSVRLGVELLDRMMSGMSDMVLARNELARRLRDVDADPALDASLERLSATVAEMRDTVTRTRMQKIDALFSALPRMVRDTAATLGKSVTLSLDGSDVELDREMIEVMRDPLVHIVRNAIDHGIESPQERRAAGKRENGRLSVAARQSGNQIIIEIADDGRGIDTDRLIRKLVKNGSRSERELMELSARARIDLVFEPGLSSKDEVTAISGRGVGMDVVRASIEQIGGRIDLQNRPGQGLLIAIRVPLTLSIIPTIVVGVGGLELAIPRQPIEEIVRDRGDAIRIDLIGDTSVATVRDRRLPLVDLARLLGTERTGADAQMMLVIINLGSISFAIAVDSVLDNEELVIKPAAPAVMATGIYAGQTLPDSGRPMLMLDCAGVARAAGISGATVVDRDAEAVDAEAAAAEGIRVLLFEDLDGVRRAMPLAIVDRVEKVDAIAIRHSAGRLRLAVDGSIVALAAVAPPPPGEEVLVLRLRDEASELGYAVAETGDIVTLAGDIAPPAAPGMVAGVALVDNDPVELLDPHWLFTHHGAEAIEGDRAPICLIGADPSGWIGTFLRPMLEGYGYRVTQRLGPEEQPAIVLTLDAPPPDIVAPAPVVRLTSDRGAAETGQIYRYDRAALIDALQRAVTGGRR